jgi:16S rRNA U516 pseudouridylate synthase RsuA-like enzyme
LDLKRTQIGDFALGDIKEGKYMVLNEKQIMALTNKMAAPLLNTK